MNQNLKKTLLSAMIAATVLSGPGISEARAYIDPGTGGSLFSSLGLMLGVCAAFAAMLLSQIRRCAQWFWVKLYFRKHRDSTPEPAAES